MTQPNTIPPTRGQEPDTQVQVRVPGPSLPLSDPTPGAGTLGPSAAGTSGGTCTCESSTPSEPSGVSGHRLGFDPYSTLKSFAAEVYWLMSASTCGQEIDVLEIARLMDALDQITKLGGNLPDDRLTDPTGPNDARHRGLMYVEARRIAREALEHAAARDPRVTLSPCGSQLQDSSLE